jgi:hypothetical protein
MVAKKDICPVCGQDTHSYKVSQLYIETLMKMKQGDEVVTPIFDQLRSEMPEEMAKKNTGKNYYRDMIEAFQAPQGGNESMRSVNPDWVAIALALFLVYMLYQIYATQNPLFWYSLGITVLLYAAYFIFHKKIMAKFLAEKQKDSGGKELIEKAVGKWMKLYYCSTDNVVYGLKKDESIPLRHMKSYLMEKARE